MITIEGYGLSDLEITSEESCRIAMKVQGCHKIGKVIFDIHSVDPEIIPYYLTKLTSK